MFVKIICSVAFTVLTPAGVEQRWERLAGYEIRTTVLQTRHGPQEAVYGNFAEGFKALELHPYDAPYARIVPQNACTYPNR